MNYHLFNAFSFLEHRFGLDVNPVGLQSSFNPLLDLPYYFLSVHVFPEQPRLVAFLAGLPTGALIYLTILLCQELAPLLPGGGRMGVAFAAVLGLSGTMLYSEVGTTFGDIPLTLLTLGGLICPLRSLRGSRTPGRWGRACMVAGVCLGAAAGLKPTMVIYAPALFIALAVTGDRGERWIGALCVALGWALGFALVYGWWGLRLEAAYGNPMFPLFNRLFRSDWVPPLPYTDDRFLPRGLAQALFYPFYWLKGRAFVASETGVRDPHFAFAYVTVVGLGTAALWGRIIGRPHAVLGHPQVRLVITFFLAGFMLWEALFSILRYAIPLEVLTGPIIGIGMTAALHALPAGCLPRRRLPILLLLVLAVTIGWANRPGWGRLKQFGTSVFAFAPPPVEDDAVIVLADKPLGFIAPFFTARGVVFVGLQDLPPPGFRLYEAAKARIAEPRPAYALTVTELAAHREALAAFGLKGVDASCQAVVNPFLRDVQLCRLDRAP